MQEQIDHFIKLNISPVAKPEIDMQPSKGSKGLKNFSRNLIAQPKRTESFIERSFHFTYPMHISKQYTVSIRKGLSTALKCSLLKFCSQLQTPALAMVLVEAGTKRRAGNSILFSSTATWSSEFS